MKRVCIVGGSSGIGFALVRACRARGDAVVSIARRVVPDVPSLQVDLADASARFGVVAKAAAKLSGLDALVYCAGIATHDDARAVLEVNLLAALELMDEALALVSTGGSVVALGSTLAHNPLPHTAAYSASKAGLIAAAKAFALRGAKRRVRVNVLSPGLVDTPMLAGRDLAALGALAPYGLGAPAEVAQALLALLDLPWLTGSELIQDGGLLLQRGH